MLTDSDVHYLAGLLLLLSTDSNVRIDLGKKVVDATIPKPRDVDVVLTTTKEGVDEHSLGGIEVKDHDRKLDVTHVEQLGAKLRDMPALETRGIVSASGYTDPALKKCEAYGVRALCLQRWVPAESPLNHVSFPADLCFSAPLLVPHGPIGLRYTSGSNDSVVNPAESARPCEWYVDGVRQANITTIGQLNDAILAAFHEGLPEDMRNHITENGPFPFDMRLLFTEKEHMLTLNGDTYKIDSVAIQGNLSRKVDQIPMDWRALVDATSGDYFAGAGVAVLQNGALIGLALTTRNEQAHIIHVSPEDRVRRVIRNQNLGPAVCETVVG